MPDVIDLLSSSSPTSPRKSLVSKSDNTPWTRIDHSRKTLPKALDSSLFDDDWFDKPAKKPRISPEGQENIIPSPGSQESHIVCLSDDDGPATSRAMVNKNATGKAGWDFQNSDPIEFTSSAPEIRRTKRATQKTSLFAVEEDDFDDLSPLDESISFSQPIPKRAHLSERTANLLANIGSGPSKFKSKSSSITTTTFAGSIATSRFVSTINPKAKAKADVDDEESDTAVSKPIKASKRAKLTDQGKELRAQERAAAKARKEHEREAEKEAKRILREEKTREKQLADDIAQVNKAKTDKKISSLEMIVDVCYSFEDSSVGNQVGEFMKHLGVEMTFFQSRIPGIIKWRRKVTARYNEEAGHWEPVPLEVQEENHVLCLMSAKFFVEIASVNDEDEMSDAQSLDSHVRKVKGKYPSCKAIYLIEGLNAWLRKNKNTRNRAYQAAVLGQMEATNGSAPPSSQQNSRRKKTKAADSYIDEDNIEDALLRLQVTHGCLIHHTSSPPESAEWMKNFTEHISTIPYRQERTINNDTSFCMDVGQVKTGDDKADTYVKMLQEILRVTPSMAYGIAAEYPSVVKLVQGFKREGNLMLQDVRKSANRNGAVSESRVGPAMSRRLCKVFTGLEEGSRDV